MIQMYLHRLIENIQQDEKEKNNVFENKEYITYTLHPLKGLNWKTTYKSEAGVLSFEVYNDPDFYCDIGDIVELYAWDDEKNKPVRVLKYRILELELTHKTIKVVAYDQLIHLIRSKESIKITRIDLSGWNDKYENCLLYKGTKFIPGTSKLTKEYKKYEKRRNDTRTNFIIPSELVIQIAKRYNLEVDQNNYSIEDYNKYTVEFLKPRIAIKEKPIDILQSYFNLYMIYNNKIFSFYDGGNGLCYVPLISRKTFIYYDETDIINYSLHQKLSDKYVSVVGFILNKVQEEEYHYEEDEEIEEIETIQLPEPYENVSVDRKIIKKVTVLKTGVNKTPYVTIEAKKFSKYNSYGIFYDTEEIKKIEITNEKTGKKEIYKTEEEVMNLRTSYYESIQHPIYDLQLTIGQGNWKIRGGSIIGLKLKTFNQKSVFIEVLIESIEHVYNSEKDHTMNVTIRGTNL